MTSIERAPCAPLLEEWREAVAGTSIFQTVSDRIRRGENIELPTLPGSLPIVLLAVVVSELPGMGLLAVLPEPEEAEAAALDFTALLGEGTVRLLPPWPFAAYEELSPSPLLSFERCDALVHLCRLAAGTGNIAGDARDEIGGVVVTSAPALTQWSADRRELLASELELVGGGERSFEELVERLIELGYERTGMVEGPAEFAVRGGLIDISPPSRDHGIRVEFWGDRIESLREFKLRDQRAVGVLGGVSVPAVREVPMHEEAMVRALERAGTDLAGGILPDTPLERALEREQFWEGLQWYLPLFVRTPSTVADLLPDGSIVVMWEPERVEETLLELHRQAAEDYAGLEQPGGWLPPERILTPADILDRLRDSFPGVNLPLVAAPGAEAVRTDAGRAPAVSGEFNRLREEIERLHRKGLTPTILVEEEGQRRRLADLLGEEVEEGPRLLLGQLSEGFVWPEARLAVWPDHEIFRRPRRSRRPRTVGGRFIRSYRSLNVGDLVVHVDHGIGRYEGLRSLEVDGVHTELLELVYAGGDRLLVPIDQMARVQRYIGAKAGATPPLNTLGGKVWERAVERARTDLFEMAEELARLYAARKTLRGTAYPPDDLLMEELEASFPYEETQDQVRAVEEVKRDLESSRNMDRLICGDVGYGKTEVAIRAGLKVIEGGGQVAVLVPTTVLAQQHLETFRQRLDGFPVRIEMLSRFRTRSQQRRTLEDLASGQVDLVIGTHRLLSRDVSFSRLGLVVVDEEHRFGVRAKEKLKSIRTQVDVLSLTATPIPRTLHMSLLGIRDISIINTPPEDRLPIHTEVVRFDEGLIEGAIRREMDRGGQIFFVHNRVQSIDAAVGLVGRLVPEARIGLAHGQMNERKLERAMLEFASGGTDVLVSTMIVESGLDLPNANTLLVNRADRLGLAQLYQLRGRVGRSSQKAYAYFLVPPGHRLNRDARRRLQAVQEHSELGAGLNLAMRDLEIRGAGNLLGAQQHGYIAAVGYDLFQEMLEEAVAEIHGTPAAIWSPPRLELPGEAFLPEAYVSAAGLRLEFYRRAVEARSIEEVGGLYAELRDRFGPLPPEAGALLDASIMRIMGAELGLDSLVVQKNMLIGRLPADRKLDRPSWEAFLERLGSAAQFTGHAPLMFQLQLSSEAPFDQIREARNRLLTDEEARYVTTLMSDTSAREGAIYD